MKLSHLFHTVLFLAVLVTEFGCFSAEAQSPTPRFAYVSSKIGETDPGIITAFTIDPFSGSLSSVGVFTAGVIPVVARVDPTGRFLYAANLNSDNISAYTIDGPTGKLTPVPGSPFSCNQPWEVAIDPTGQFIYAADGTDMTVSGFKIDRTSGALTPVPGSPFGPFPGVDGSSIRSVQVHPSRPFAYAVDSFATPPAFWAFTIDPLSGVLTQIPGSPFLGDSTDAHSLTIDPLGRFAFAENSVDRDMQGDVTSFRIDSTSGALTLVPGSPFPAGAYTRWVAVDQRGRFVYAVNFDNDTVSGYSIDPNGALTAVPRSPFRTGAGPISVTATDRFVYVANELAGSVSGYAIGDDGSLTELSGSPYDTGGGSPESVTTTAGPQ